MIPEEDVPVGKIDDDQPAGDECPAENHRADCADEFAQHPFRKSERLDGRRGEDLPDSSSGEGQFRNPGSADAEVVGEGDERIGREGEEQHQAEEQHQLTGEEEEWSSFSRQEGPDHPQQRETEQDIRGQAEEVEEPVCEECAEVADPVSGGGVDAAGDGGAVGGAVGEHGEKDQQQAGEVEDIADPESGFPLFHADTSGRPIAHLASRPCYPMQIQSDVI